MKEPEYTKDEKEIFNQFKAEQEMLVRETVEKLKKLRNGIKPKL